MADPVSLGTVARAVGAVLPLFGRGTPSASRNIRGGTTEEIEQRVRDLERARPGPFQAVRDFTLAVARDELARRSRVPPVGAPAPPPDTSGGAAPTLPPPPFFVGANIMADGGGEVADGPGRRASSRARAKERRQAGRMQTPPQGSGLPREVWEKIPPAAREKIIQVWIKLGPNGQKFFKIAAKKLARVVNRVGQAGVLAVVFEFVDFITEWFSGGDPIDPPPEFEPESAPVEKPKPAAPAPQRERPVVVRPEVKVVVLPAPAPAPKPAPKPRPAPPPPAPAPMPLPPLPPLPPPPRVPNPVFEVGRILGGLILNRQREAAPQRTRDLAVAPVVPQVMQQFAPPLTVIGSRQAECVCPPKKKRSGPRRRRAVCYSGTFTETATGLRKRRKRKIPCRA